MVQKFTDVAQQFLNGTLSRDQIEALYGSETLDRIAEHFRQDPSYTHYA